MKSKKLSILIISADFPPNIVGGQGIYAYQVAKGLAQGGHCVVVITSKKMGLLAKKQCFEVYNVNYDVKEKNLLRFSWLAYKFFNKNLKNKKFDILHGNAINHFFFGIKKPKNIQNIVTTIHNTYLQRFHVKDYLWKIIYPPFILLEKICLEKSDRIIAVSNTTRDAILKYKIPASKISVIYNGVDTNKFTPTGSRGKLRSKLNLSNSDSIVLYAGRLYWGKNPETILHAIKNLASPNIHAVFAGDGPLKDKLIMLSKKLKIEDRIHILGSIPHGEMPEVYRDSDVDILPSSGEGAPLTLLEAGASGLPLLATEHATGASSIIEDGLNGYIIRLSNIKGIAHKILLSLENKKRMGNESRKKVVKYFTWEESLNKTFSVYQELQS